MKNKKRLLLSIACVLLVLAAGIRIWHINANAFSIQEKIYQVGEWVPLKGDFFWNEDEKTDDYSIRVSSAEALSYTAFMERFRKPADYLAEPSQRDVILLKLDFKNAGEEQGSVFTREMNLLNESRSEYHDKTDVYMDIVNPNFSSKNFGLSVRPGTEASLYFVYTTAARADLVSYLDEQREKGVKEMKMYLIVSQYPVQKLIELNLDLSGIY